MTTNPICTIVGAGEGLGQSLAKTFARNGFDIALVTRSLETTKTFASTLQTEFGDSRVACFSADVTHPSECEKTLTSIANDFGACEVLIYNVCDGFHRCAPLELEYDDLERTLKLEVIGALAAAKSVIPDMRKRGSGTVLFSSATAAYRGSASYPAYAIGKFGLRALSQSLAKAYAADGVHVAHIRLDCDLDVPIMQALYGDKYDPEVLADPDSVAENYWWVYRQPKSAWSNEVELRPNTEIWTY